MLYLDPVRLYLNAQPDLTPKALNTKAAGQNPVIADCARLAPMNKVNH